MLSGGGGGTHVMSVDASTEDASIFSCLDSEEARGCGALTDSASDVISPEWKEDASTEPGSTHGSLRSTPSRSPGAISQPSTIPPCKNPERADSVSSFDDSVSSVSDDLDRFIESTLSSVPGAESEAWPPVSPLDGHALPHGIIHDASRASSSDHGVPPIDLARCASMLEQAAHLQDVPLSAGPITPFFGGRNDTQFVPVLSSDCHGAPIANADLQDATPWVQSALRGAGHYRLDTLRSEAELAQLREDLFAHAQMVDNRLRELENMVLSARRDRQCGSIDGLCGSMSSGCNTQ